MIESKQYYLSSGYFVTVTNVFSPSHLDSYSYSFLCPFVSPLLLLLLSSFFFSSCSSCSFLPLRLLLFFSAQWQVLLLPADDTAGICITILLVMIGFGQYDYSFRFSGFNVSVLFSSQVPVTISNVLLYILNVPLGNSHSAVSLY